MLPLLLLLQQAPLPQVGDSIWLVRTIPVQAGREVRVPVWNPEGAVEALGPGFVMRRGDSLEVRYPVVGWLPGSHAVEVPGPILVAPSGATDTLPPITLTVTIGSVLPNLGGDSLPPPQPEAAPVLRPVRAAGPVLALVLLAALLLVPLHLGWRRRARGAAPSGPEGTREPSPLPVADWIAAGEPRAVLAVAAARLRASPRASGPEAEALLAELDRALFGPGDVSGMLPAAERALALAAADDRAGG